jgi:excinuclease UvrABC helicase subunit UvrB
MLPKKPVVDIPVLAEQSVTYAENQPEYMPLPVVKSASGVVMSRWELTDEEMEILIKTKSIYLQVHTFNQMLQPVSLFVEPETANAFVKTDANARTANRN